MKTFFHSIHISIRIIRNLLLAGLIFVALALSIVRFWLLPKAPEWREELQNKISTMVGATVRVKSLSAGMHGFRPELSVRGLRIESVVPNAPALEFERLGVGLDVMDSLRSRQAVINHIELEGSRLRLLRLADGSITLAGLRPGGGSPLWLFAEGEVRLADIDLEWVNAEDAPPIPLGRVKGRLRNAGDRHMLDARVDLPGKLGKSVRLSADIIGNPLASKDWHGRGYLEAKRMREGAFAEALPVRLRSGEIGLQVWGEWRGGMFSEAQARIELERPVFTWRRDAGQPDGLLSVDKLAAWLRWQHEADAWRLDVQHFLLVQNGKTWPETDFSVAVTPGADGSVQTVRAAVGYLRLDDITGLLGGMPVLQDSQRETLRAVSAHGEVRNARLIYQAEGRVGFCGDLLALSFKLNPNWPGPNRFTGHVCGNDRDGRMDVNMGKTEFNLPGLYPKGLAVDALNGHFAWHRVGGNPLVLFPPAEPVPPVAQVQEFIGPPAPPNLPVAEPAPPAAIPEPAPKPPLFAGSGWQIVGNQIKLTALGLQATGGFALDLPISANDSPNVDLNAQLRNVDAAHIRDYLPLSAMHPVTAQWHSEAYVAGQVHQADVRLRGKLADFPFAHGGGEFAVNMDADNLELNFNPQWPHLYGVKANVVLAGPSLSVETLGGSLGDLPLRPVHASAPTLEGEAWLNIASDMDIELAKALTFLQQTPVRHIPQRLAKGFDASGEAHLDLQLAIPLGLGETSMAGRLQLKNDAMALKAVNLKVHDVVGELAFTESNLEGKHITAKALDEAILIDVAQNLDDILFDIGGKAGVPALRGVFPGDFWQQAEGAFSYRLNLQIPKTLDASSGPVRIDLASDLVGLELKLPAPLVKSAAVKKDFIANVSLRSGGESALRLAYGREGLLRLLLSADDQLESGDVFWNMQQTPASGELGLGLFLKLNTLDLGAWRKLFASTGNGTVSGPIMPRALDIDVDSLSWNGDNLESFKMTGRRESGALSGHINCLYGKGNYKLVDDEFSRTALSLDLEHLNLPKLADDKDGQASTAPDPAGLPDLQIHARHLYRLGADLGELDMEAERWLSGINIKHLRVASDNHELLAKGSWMREDGRDESKLNGRLKVRDLGAMLALLGYDKEINRTPGESAFLLNWSGAPQQFSAARLNGEINLKLGRGSVLQLEPGLGRALGMLNLQTLRRLLLLDFSDLFGKGLAYDGMEGIFTLNAGQARTRGFVIDAVAADILVIGRVGLADHDLEQTISVMPHPLASIPLAAPMIGGAAVGAIIDIAHRLVGAEDANITSTNYAVTGTWDSPQYKRIQASGPIDMVNKAWNDLKGLSDMDRRGGEDVE